MAERNRHGQEDRDHEDWNREQRPASQGRSRSSGDYEEPTHQQAGNWENAGARGYGREHGGYSSGSGQWESGRGAWQPGPSWQGGTPGQGYGSQRGGGWDLDEGRFQGGRGAGERAWQGPPGTQERGFAQSGYGRGGYGGYGLQAGGGYSAYGSQAGGSHRETPAPGMNYGTPTAPRSYGGYGSRSGQYGDLSAERWMGEGYGGPSSREAQSGRYDFGPWTPARPRRSQQRWPKSYTRSDERIREDLYERIVLQYTIDATEVSIIVAEGRVTLEGTVPERHMKHDIENIADDCPGVKDIDNKIRVQEQGSLFTHGSLQPNQGK